MSSDESQRELRDIALSLEVAAQAFKAQNYSVAEPIYRRAVNVLERILGPNDPDTVVCLQTLGDLYYKQGRYQEALPHYKRLLTIGEQMLGSAHPSVNEMVMRLASTYQNLGMQNEADFLYKRATRASSTLPSVDMSPRQTNSLNAMDVPAANARDAQSPRQTGSPNAMNPPPPGQTGSPNPMGPSPRQTGSPNAMGPSPRRTGSPNAMGPSPRRTGSPDAMNPPSGSPRRTNNNMPGSRDREPNPFDEGTKPRANAVASRNASRYQTEAPVAPKAKDVKRTDAATEDAKQAFLIAVRRSSGMIISFVVLGVMIFCGYMMFNTWNSEAAKNGAEIKVRDVSYKTADGQIDLVVSPKGEPTYKINAVALPCTITKMGPDLLDFKDSILSSLLNKEIWFEETPSGLRREDGTVLYSKNGPEMRVVRQIDAAERLANQWYLGSGKYPKQNGDIVLGDMAINPVTKQPEQPSVDHLDAPNMDVEEFVDVPHSDLPLATVLTSASSAAWLKEAAGHPGAVHCLNATHTLPNSEVKEFFIHGFDRDGKLIAGSKPNEIYLTALTNGKKVLRESVQIPRYNRPPKICIVKLPDNTPLWFLHYLAPIVFLGIALLLFMISKAGQSASTRDNSGSTSFRLGIVFLILAALWVGSYFI
ncbi:MAG TPA: tetratricopeptide repeat protein [Drouetiella sp.]